MKPYAQCSAVELEQLYGELSRQYADYQRQNLKLDMSRGKPGRDQLDLSEGLLRAVQSNEECFTDSGVDTRNYGLLDGIPEAKELFAEILEVSPEEVIVGGNSSLTMMFDAVSKAMTHGILGGERPWGKLDKVKFLCPVPGYDRHFTICEFFGIEMVNIPMDQNGPDMDLVEKYVSEDESIKGIWCVPKYSNPQGITYSDEVVRRFANLSPRAKDFRIFWDNAYCVHHLFGEDHLLNIFDELKKTGKEDMVYEFCSTSKISYPGAGVAAMAASRANVEFIKKQLFAQQIGPDKMNQLRHVRYFKNAAGIRAQMELHAQILRPKFQAVLDALDQEIRPLNIGSWDVPNGGYFIGFYAMEGCAKRIVSLCREAGVVLTSAGATYPYQRDPADSSIRLAPTLPPIDELKKAAALFCLCVKLASVEKLLKKV